MASLDDQLLEAWDTHIQMFTLLFDALAPEVISGKPTGMTGRSVGNILAHVNNQRWEWIKVSAPELLDGLMRIPVKSKAEREAISKEQLAPALEKSAAAMRQMFEAAIPKGKLKGQKTPLLTMHSYMIAHEWYHIGEIGMTANEAGHKIDEQTEWAIWSWGRWTPGGRGSETGE